MENLEKLVNDPEAMEIIASKESSMWAFMYNTDAFAALINSETAMEKVAVSETAVKVITQSIADAANAETVLTDIKEHLTGIEGSLPNIPDNEKVTEEVAEAKYKVDTTISSLHKVTCQTDVLVNNIDALLNNDTAIRAILNISTNGATAIFSTSQNAKKVLTGHVDIIKNSIPAMRGMYNNYNIIEPLLTSDIITALQSSDKRIILSHQTSVIEKDKKMFVFALSTEIYGNGTDIGGYTRPDAASITYVKSGRTAVNKFAKKIKVQGSLANHNGMLDCLPCEGWE